MLFFFLFWEGTVIVGRGVGTETTVYLVCYLKILFRLDLPPSSPLPFPPPSWGPKPLPMIVTFRLDFCLSLFLFSGRNAGSFPEQPLVIKPIKQPHALWWYTVYMHRGLLRLKKAEIMIWQLKSIWPLWLWYFHCRVVTYKTGKSLADSWKAAFFESSAKENSVSELGHIVLFLLTKNWHLDSIHLHAIVYNFCY